MIEKHLGIGPLGNIQEVEPTEWSIRHQDILRWGNSHSYSGVVKDEEIHGKIPMSPGADSFEGSYLRQYTECHVADALVDIAWNLKKIQVLYERAMFAALNTEAFSYGEIAVMAGISRQAARQFDLKHPERLETEEYAATTAKRARVLADYVAEHPEHQGAADRYAKFLTEHAAYLTEQPEPTDN